MNIFIVTFGRPGFQVTWRGLPPSIKARTKLLVNYEEADVHADLPVQVLPEGLRGIGNVRQWAIDNSPGKVLMMDDDLAFYRRRDDDRRLLREMTSEETEAMFSEIESTLDEYPLVGVASREGANRNTEKRTHDTRILRLLGYRADIMRQHGVTFTRLPVMEDFDVALQLLENGHHNCVLNDWAHNQAKGSNAPGGCSTYRTAAVQAAAADGLARLHPGLVSVVTKQTKTAWNGQERKDVTIQWKRAYNAKEKK